MTSRWSYWLPCQVPSLPDQCLQSNRRETCKTLVPELRWFSRQSGHKYPDEGRYSKIVAWIVYVIYMFIAALLQMEVWQQPKIEQVHVISLNWWPVSRCLYLKAVYLLTGKGWISIGCDGVEWTGKMAGFALTLWELSTSLARRTLPLLSLEHPAFVRSPARSHISTLTAVCHGVTTYVCFVLIYNEIHHMEIPML